VFTDCNIVNHHHENPPFGDVFSNHLVSNPRYVSIVSMIFLKVLPQTLEECFGPKMAPKGGSFQMMFEFHSFLLQFYYHPEPWGIDPNLTLILQLGLKLSTFHGP